MHEVVRDHGLELLHAHYAIPHATSAWIAREMLEENDMSVRIITTLHGTDITLVGQDPSFQAITKFSIERSNGLTAVSEYLKRETYSAFGCSACAVDVIPNFIDPLVYDRARYQPLLREQVDGNRKILIHVSNFRAGEARARHRAGLRARAAGAPGGARDGGRRPRARRRGAGGARPRRARPDVLPREARRGRAAARERRSLPPAERERVVRALGARGARLRRPGGLLERRRSAARSCARG